MGDYLGFIGKSVEDGEYYFLPATRPIRASEITAIGDMLASLSDDWVMT